MSVPDILHTYDSHGGEGCFRRRIVENLQVICTSIVHVDKAEPHGDAIGCTGGGEVPETWITGRARGVVIHVFTIVVENPAQLHSVVQCSIEKEDGDILVLE